MNHLVIGECIYCGRRPPEAKLSDEHPIPLALGSKRVVRKASCEKCAEITGKFERFLLRGTLFPLRIAIKAFTRRPQNRPKTLPLEFTMPDGSRVWHQVSVEEYALAVYLPYFGRATFWDGLPPNKEGACGLLKLGTIGDLKALLAKYGATDVRWEMRIRPDEYVRFIAKIAHGAAAGLGYHGKFKPVLTPLILGDNSYPWHYVGGDIEEGKRPERQKSTHMVNIKWEKIRGEEYAVARVWLFAALGAEPHYAILGPRIAD